MFKAVETVAPTRLDRPAAWRDGHGKGVIARAIHNLSPRHNRTFVRLNVAALPVPLLESELFGYEKGAFTGAMTSRFGRLELANHGTLFLDEVGDIPVEVQPKLLRVLQERESKRLGSTQHARVDVRLIAATSRDLDDDGRRRIVPERLGYIASTCFLSGFRHFASVPTTSPRWCGISSTGSPGDAAAASR